MSVWVFLLVGCGVSWGLRLPVRMSASHKVESMGGVHKISFEVGGRSMSFETGKIGRQAGGSVMARTMDTIVYSTVCSERDAKPVDFTPLRVDYFARFSAVGQTIGAFHRRDSRGDDSEILIARLIDRPIRPMIAEGWQHDTQILAWVLSYDKQHPPEALSINAASAAMCISDVPMIKPVAGVEVAMIDGELVVNPTRSVSKNATMLMTVAGTKDGILMIEGVADFLPEESIMAALVQAHQAIGVICDAIDVFQSVAGKPKKLDTLRRPPLGLMTAIDSEFGLAMRESLSVADKHDRGRAVGIVEAAILSRFTRVSSSDNDGVFGESVIRRPLAAESSKGVGDIAPIPSNDPDAPLVEGLLDESDGPRELMGLVDISGEISPGGDGRSVVIDKGHEDEDESSELGRGHGLDTSSTDNAPGPGFDSLNVKIATKKLLVRNLRRVILQTGRRSDGRGVEEVRPLAMETDLLPGAHGSALFTRGETQSLSTATLGSKAMEMRVETLDSMTSKRFFLQYRFPPSSVGEVGRVGGINRREVGHGNLAERALEACLPSAATFPYSIRAESLITESCGSSSMATVCGCCLALLDAGVPLSTTVAGIAMGLILPDQEDDYPHNRVSQGGTSPLNGNDSENRGQPVILTDILGLEDALGTMDFKIAGNETGITTFQLDIKSEGLTLSTLSRSLQQARRGRLHILAAMKEHCVSAPLPRPLKPTIPKILSFTVPPEALGKVIGPKGATVTKLIEEHGLVNINLEDNGEVQIESFSTEKNALVQSLILKIAESAVSGSGDSGAGGSRRDKSGGTASKDVAPKGPPPEEGLIYRECSITGVQKFGVFVEMLPGYEGLVHVSELDTTKVTDPAEAGYAVGQKLSVKYLGKNDKGQMRLSRRAVLLRDSTGA